MDLPLSLDGSLWRFPERWPHREASLDWVRSQIQGVTTFAVDGSQIYPSKDFSLPIALVQIAWFENPHQLNQPYTKDIAVDLLAPADFQDLSPENFDRLVNMRRFQMETERLVQFLESHAGQPNCCAFLDGSLVATFAEAFEAETQQVYIDCLVRLLRASENSRVPLIAYIDTSSAKDLAELLQDWFEELPEPRSLVDAQIVAQGLRWGDRTPLLRCRRSILKVYAEQGDRLAYCYLKTHDGNPVRIELPLWLVESGRHETVLNWLRAEVIAGGGYPYAIETADQAAVLRSDDRQLFYRLLQEWCEQEGLNLSLSRKLVSKLRRR
nr:DNA double-strand break repair nuclease NurA [Synechococcus elongatus]